MSHILPQAPILTHSENVLDAFFQVEKQTWTGESEPYTRYRVHPRHAMGVIVFDIDAKEFILTKQYRTAVQDFVIEIAAGVLDENESHEEAAHRELNEELGLATTNLISLGAIYNSPGYTSEKLLLFLALVDSDAKVADGGGLHQENEHIESLTMSLQVMEAAILTGTIIDAKTIVAFYKAKHVLSQNSLISDLT